MEAGNNCERSGEFGQKKPLSYLTKGGIILYSFMRSGIYRPRPPPWNPPRKPEEEPKEEPDEEREPEPEEEGARMPEPEENPPTRPKLLPLPDRDGAVYPLPNRLPERLLLGGEDHVGAPREVPRGVVKVRSL